MPLKIRGLSYSRTTRQWVARKTHEHRTYEVRARSAAEAAAALNELLTTIGLCPCRHIHASVEQLEALTASRSAQ